MSLQKLDEDEAPSVLNVKSCPAAVAVDSLVKDDIKAPAPPVYSRQQCLIELEGAEAAVAAAAAACTAAVKVAAGGVLAAEASRPPSFASGTNASVSRMLGDIEPLLEQLLLEESGDTIDRAAVIAAMSMMTKTVWDLSWNAERMQQQNDALSAENTRLRSFLLPNLPATTAMSAAATQTEACANRQVPTRSSASQTILGRSSCAGDRRSTSMRRKASDNIALASGTPPEGSPATPKDTNCRRLLTKSPTRSSAARSSPARSPGGSRMRRSTSGCVAVAAQKLEHRVAMAQAAAGVGAAAKQLAAPVIIPEVVAVASAEADRQAAQAAAQAAAPRSSQLILAFERLYEAKAEAERTAVLAETPPCGGGGIARPRDDLEALCQPPSAGLSADAV